ncbi:uncharacterized protein LOC116919860 [Daphnia magna]|uniref:uncharacterized protein LOC116919860 n=1 Tax=Daphnia magna TaxID=35525 RepID=UPI001E1BCEFB|nr:uncharacterized protein LOC116919860 [Daphnia magna]
MLKKPRMVIAITQEGNEIQTPTEEVTKRLATLKMRVERIQDEASIENASLVTQSQAMTRISYDRTWLKRRENVDAGWVINRNTYLSAFIKHKALSEREVCCNCHISIPYLAVRCNTCHANLCPECDWAFHFKRPFHYRELFGESSSRPLLPSECVHSNGHVVEKAVPGPLHIPPDCADCAEKSTVQLFSGSTCIAIVTKDGH